MTTIVARLTELLNERGREIELLQEIEKHNSAKAQLLHEIYQAGLLDSDPYKKERASVLLSGRLPKE